MPHARRGSGFTLIELLVVIAIIAVLISLLLPALKRAKRNVKVIVCSANLKSYALGLNVYATEDGQGHYPVQDGGSWGSFMKVWQGPSKSSVYGAINPDANSYLNMFADIVCGGDGRILWCPFDRWYNPQVPGSHVVADPNHPDLYYRAQFQAYLTSYLRYTNDRGAGTDWTNSGNSNHGPPVSPNSAQDAIVADLCTSHPSGYQEVHMDNLTAAPPVTALTQRRENNVAYSDGHVETHGQRPFMDAGGFLTWHGAQYVIRWGERHQY